MDIYGMYICNLANQYDVSEFDVWLDAYQSYKRLPEVSVDDGAAVKRPETIS